MVETLFGLWSWVMLIGFGAALLSHELQKQLCLDEAIRETRNSAYRQTPTRPWIKRTPEGMSANPTCFSGQLSFKFPVLK